MSAGLSADHGVAYARALADFAHNKICLRDGKEVPSRLWTSTLRRTRETAQFITQKKLLVKDESGEIGSSLLIIIIIIIISLYISKCELYCYS